MKFNKQCNEIRAILQEHWHLLTEDSIIKHFVDPSPRITFKRNRSLRDILTSSHFDRHQGSDPCGTHPRSRFWYGDCDYCHFVLTLKDLLVMGSVTIRPRHFVNCETKGIIYLLTGGCDTFYVGKTKRMLWQWIKEHVDDIQDGISESRLQGISGSAICVI